jgi:hypothetical protein
VARSQRSVRSERPAGITQSGWNVAVSSPSEYDLRALSLFRPARTVTDPSGTYWELFVSKTVLPAWKQGDSGDVGFFGGRMAPLDLLSLPFAVLGAVWSVLVFPAVRFLALLPGGVVKGRRSRAVRIEAVTNFPEREVRLWTTTEGLVEIVLDEIVAGLAAGKVVQPEGCVYSGRETG